MQVDTDRLLKENEIKANRMMTLIAGVTIAVIGICISRPMLHAMGSPENVIDLSTIYLRIFFSGMPFMMLSK